MYTALILFSLLAITVSFLCSMWEAVLLSITPAFAQIKLEEGSRTGRRLQAFKENVDRPLAAILTLNTIAHTVGAIGVGEQAGKIWAETNPLVTGIVVPVVMTLAILILSEIIPKTLGANFWRELVPFTVASLTTIITLLLPLVWVSQQITRVLKRDKEKSVFSRSDFLAMAEIGAKQGVFEQRESEIIANLLGFDSVRVEDVMTPRTAVIAAPQTLTVQELFDRHEELRMSRIPIYEDDHVDHVTGYILKDQVLEKLVAGEGETLLTELRRPILAVEASVPIPSLFRRFLEERDHIALVSDKFGGMAGIATMEDVIETLLGTEIVDETDAAADLREMARQSWRRRARRLGLIDEPSAANESKRQHDTASAAGSAEGREAAEEQAASERISR